MRRAVLGLVGGIVLAGMVGALAGCGSSHATATTTPTVTTTVTTTTAPPHTTTVTTTTVTTTIRTRPRTRATTAGGGGTTTASVDAITDDGAVLTLDDGSVYSVPDSGDQSTVSGWSSGDSVSVSDAQDSIFNTSSGESVSVTYVGDSSDSATYAGTGQSIAAKSDDGSIIVLDDNSIWIVASYDRSTSAYWTDADSITVNDSGATDQLVDTDSQGETVDANYIGQE
jgi:hypothetical protein